MNTIVEVWKSGKDAKINLITTPFLIGLVIFFIKWGSVSYFLCFFLISVFVYYYLYLNKRLGDEHTSLYNDLYGHLANRIEEWFRNIGSDIEDYNERNKYREDLFTKDKDSVFDLFELVAKNSFLRDEFYYKDAKGKPLAAFFLLLQFIRIAWISYSSFGIISAILLTLCFISFTFLAVRFHEVKDTRCFRYNSKNNYAPEVYKFNEKDTVAYSYMIRQNEQYKTLLSRLNQSYYLRAPIDLIILILTILTFVFSFLQPFTEVIP